MTGRQLTQTSSAFAWCFKEACKVDFLTKEERMQYAIVLLQAVIWGQTH